MLKASVSCFIFYWMHVNSIYMKLKKVCNKYYGLTYFFAIV